MEGLRDVKVKYTHPAIPPIGIEVDKVYTVGQLLEIYKSNELVKVMFSPIGTTWNKLDNKNIRKNKSEDIVVTVAKDLEVSIDRAE